MPIKRRKPRTWTLEQAYGWRVTYEASNELTIKDLAAQVGIGTAALGDALLTAGATIRQPRRGGRPPTPRHPGQLQSGAMRVVSPAVAAGALANPLSARQQQVMDRLAAGASTEEIAADLVVSVETVKSHVKNVLTKLRVNDRVEAVAVCAAKGWVNRQAADDDSAGGDLLDAGWTERQREVLALVVGGQSNKEIAASLDLAATTVKTHVGEIIRRLKARNRAHAIILARENRLEL